MSGRTRRGRRLSIRSRTASRALRASRFGNFLIKQVVEEIRRELPRIETFVTLSPVPGLRAWVETCDDPAVERLAKAVREAALDERWPAKPETAAAAAQGARAARGTLLPESAARRRPGHRSRRPLSPRQRRETRADQLDGRPLAQRASQSPTASWSTISMISPRSSAITRPTPTSAWSWPRAR